MAEYSDLFSEEDINEIEYLISLAEDSQYSIRYQIRSDFKELIDSILNNLEPKLLELDEEEDEIFESISYIEPQDENDISSEVISSFEQLFKSITPSKITKQTDSISSLDIDISNVKPNIETLKHYKPVEDFRIDTILNITPKLNRPIRKKRKSWGGQSRVNEHEPDFKKMQMYSYRAMKRQVKLLDIKPLKRLRKAYGTVLRSISHMKPNLPIYAIKSRTIAINNALFIAYREYCEAIVRSHHHTGAMVDAWDLHIPTEYFDEFVRESFTGASGSGSNITVDISCFTQAPVGVREFLGDAWDMYNEKAQSGREARYGMTLTEDDVKNLEDADKSVLDPNMLHIPTGRG